AAALAFGLFCTLPASDAIDTISNAVTPPVAAKFGSLGFVSPAQGQPLTKSPADALNAYSKAVNDFRSILRQRRAQIVANQALPNLPGQPLYLARNAMMSAYKDLTDALPSRI